MTLEDIQRLVWRDQYHYSEKVRCLIEEGWFDEEDMMKCILSATRIHRRQRDELRQAVDGLKYVILGQDTHGQPFYTAGKVMEGCSGQFYFYITAHQAD